MNQSQLDVINPLALMLVVGLMSSCSYASGQDQQPSGSLATELATDYLAKDGTRFQISTGATDILPHLFPQYLFYPEAKVLSSGNIRDREGGIASLLLQTTASEDTIRDYYRQKLWYHRWDLLSQVDQEGVATMTFEQLDPPQGIDILQQVVIQIGALHSGQSNRDLLILLSSSSRQTDRQPNPTPSPTVSPSPSSGALAEADANPKP